MTFSIPRSVTLVAVAALAAASSGIAMAQTKAQVPVSTRAKAAEPLGGQRTVRAMFGWADQNRDGHLTRAEANGHLPLTFGNFDSIDTGKRGWISFEQFLVFTEKRVSKQADDVLHIGEWL